MHTAKEFETQKLNFQACEICHERCESNEETHMLATVATSLDVGRYVWLNDPLDYLCIPKDIIH